MTAGLCVVGARHDDVEGNYSDYALMLSDDDFAARLRHARREPVINNRRHTTLSNRRVEHCFPRLLVMTDADAIAGSDQRQPEQFRVALNPSQQFGIG
jgi:hypothetical protein